MYEYGGFSWRLAPELLAVAEAADPDDDELELLDDFLLLLDDWLVCPAEVDVVVVQLGELMDDLLS